MPPEVITSSLLFGSLYLSAAEFAPMASMFGLSGPVSADVPLLENNLAAASRWVEALTSKKFVPGQVFEEQHDWNEVTRRITVNNPPVLTIELYQIFTGKDTKSTFGTNTLVVNHQQNYVELTSLAAAGNMTSALLALGLFKPYVLIRYTSMNNVPTNIKLATGYLAASLMNRSKIDSELPAGIKSISVGGSTTVTRADHINSANGPYGDVPPIVNALLNSEREITIC